MLKAGIIGLPNVGKSTLFNALVENAKAQAANFPFCTIEPNKGIVSVPDQRLQELGILSSSQNIIPTKIEFVDIAGLVKGASKGEGLGNKFLSNIREVDAIVHVVRCFEDSEVIHVSGKIDPLDDIEIINLELNLANKFLGFLSFKNKILFFRIFVFNLSVIIIFDPFLIASFINKFPSVLFPLNAKKIYPSLTFLELKAIPLKLKS